MIDTHKAAKMLQQAGFNEEQASVVTDLFSNTIPWDQLVTKEHLTHVMQAQRFELAGEIKALADRIEQRLVGSATKFENRLIVNDERFTDLEIRLEKRFAASNECFTQIDRRIDNLEQRINGLEIKMEKRFADHDARFSSLDSRITQVKHELLEQIHKQSVSQTRWLIGAIALIQGLQFTLSRLI